MNLDNGLDVAQTLGQENSFLNRSPCVLTLGETVRGFNEKSHSRL